MGVPNHCGDRRMAAGVSKKSQQYHKYFFNIENLLPKDLSFEHGDDKLAACPGRHLTSLRPWVNSHMRKYAMTIITWSEPLKICCHVVVMQQRASVNNALASFSTWVCRRRSGHEWTVSSSLHHTRTVKLTLVQCECHTGPQSIIARIKVINFNEDADFRFCKNFWFLVPISRGEMPVLLNLRIPMNVAHRISLKKCPSKKCKRSGNPGSGLNQGCGAVTQISGSGSRHLNSLAPAVTSRSYWLRLRLQNNLVHWKLQQSHFIIFATCLPHKLCLCQNGCPNSSTNAWLLVNSQTPGKLPTSLQFLTFIAQVPHLNIDQSLFFQYCQNYLKKFFITEYTHIWQNTI